MKLIQLTPTKYTVVQDDHQRAAELYSIGGDLFTVGTLADIATATWFGWEQLTPVAIQGAMDGEMIMHSAKLSNIKRYAKLNRDREGL